MHKKVDLRGLTPPEPVVRTKRLLTEAEDIALDVLVDVGPSRTISSILPTSNTTRPRWWPRRPARCG